MFSFTYIDSLVLLQQMTLFTIIFLRDSIQ